MAVKKIKVDVECDICKVVCEVPATIDNKSNMHIVYDYDMYEVPLWSKHSVGTPDNNLQIQTRAMMKNKDDITWMVICKSCYGKSTKYLTSLIKDH